MAEAFFSQICEPYSYLPYHDEYAFLTLCFLDLFLIASTVLLLLFFGTLRVFQIRRRTYAWRKYTRGHILELICCGICVILPACNLIFSIVSENSNPNVNPLPLMKYFVIAGLIATWLFATILCEAEYGHGMKHGWVVISFWVASAFINGFRIQAYVNEMDQSSGSVYFIVIEMICGILLSLNAVINNKLPPPPGDEVRSDEYNSDFSLEELSDDEGAKAEKERAGLLQAQDSTYGIIPHSGEPIEKIGEDRVNFLKRYSYYWLTPLLEKGYRQQLKMEDMPDLVLNDYAAKQLYDFDRAWAMESENEHPSLTMTLIRQYGRHFFIAGCCKIGNDVGIFAGPVFLQQIVRFIEGGADQPFYIGLLLSIGMFLGKVLELVSVNIYFQHVYRINMKIKSALTQAIFTKSLRLDSDRGGFSLGEVVTLQGIDTKKIGENITYLHNVWSSPVQILVSIGLLYQVLNWAAFGGLIVLFLSLPLNLYIGKIQTALQAEIMKLRSARAKQTNEVMQGIRVVKFFAWEDSFLDLIDRTREEELEVLKKASYLRAASTFLWSFIPTLVSITSFGLLMASGRQLTAEIAFTALSLFNVMRFPLLMMPMIIMSIVNAKVSIERIQKFLLGKELDRFAVMQDEFMEERISITNGTFCWTSGEERRECLSGINLTVRSGELVAVVGEVGSGKSSLVSALLGDVTKLTGVVKLRGRLAYVPQQAFLQNGTVKDNIIFGHAVDEEKYRAVVRVCELLPDFDMLPAGERTEIGEKGINLSGGQKQRIALARAVYSDADIFLMDDPLSALDQHVGKNIFDNCISGVLKGKTIVLVTHQLQHLDKCDKILVMKEGKVTETGSYDALVSSQGEFSKLISKHTTKSLSKTSKKEETETKEKKGDDGKIIGSEQGKKGGVSIDVYWAYVTQLGGVLMVSTVLIFAFLQNGGDIGTNYWLSYWAEQNVSQTTVNASLSLTAMVMGELGADPQMRSVWFYFGIYAAIGVSIAIFSVCTSFSLTLASLHASKSIHNKMITHTLHSPMSFFDTTPVGRVLNRLNSDIASVDETLPATMGMAIRTILGVLSILVVIGTVTPIFLVLLLPLSFLYRYTQKLYLNSSREIQRIESMSKSPIYSLFGECLNGASTIRAFGRVDELNDRNTALVQANSLAYNAWYTCNRWLSLRLEFVGSVVVFGSCFFSVLSRGELAAAQAGLAISYSLQLTSFMNWMVRMTTEVENAFVSVERCIEYTTLPSEAARLLPHRPPLNWPSKGMIVFQNLSLRYREGLPLILENVNIEINANEKIGVVGRTGAGKSSLMLALFRMVEPCSGTVIIDGEDICKLGLDDLRSKISIIPQDPTLFTGTIRSNLDPFHQYTDTDIWDALSACSMRSQIEAMDKGLESEVKEGGGNISVGSRQLLCLGRALLKRSKILVMDEATASVDYETDSLIQATIRREFKNCTVLTIAHRIKTILDNDRVLVLEKGKIVEFDSPNNLIQRRDSIFYSLASST